jgi:hypothetical protein
MLIRFRAILILAPPHRQPLLLNPARATEAVLQATTASVQPS